MLCPEGNKPDKVKEQWNGTRLDRIRGKYSLRRHLAQYLKDVVKRELDSFLWKNRRHNRKD